MSARRPQASQLVIERDNRRCACPAQVLGWRPEMRVLPLKSFWRCARSARSSAAQPSSATAPRLACGKRRRLQAECRTDAQGVLALTLCYSCVDDVDFVYWRTLFSPNGAEARVQGGQLPLSCIRGSARSAPPSKAKPGIALEGGIVRLRKKRSSFAAFIVPTRRCLNHGAL